jgi:5-formyltetrahydrofolate cyclo-ligase
MQSKPELRKVLRKLRREHAESIPDSVRGLIFRHPPAPVLELIPKDAEVGLYLATRHEAPTASYARFFHEAEHRIALPHFSSSDASMQFRTYSDPHGESDLVMGPLGFRQPKDNLSEVIPDTLFVPLIGFTERGGRLGQGGGHYDRWLAEHPETRTIGLAWDCQLVEELPTEAHDIDLNAIVTPTRFYGPF